MVQIHNNYFNTNYYLPAKPDTCSTCNNITCGQPGCIEKCDPFEKRITEYEAGKRLVL